MKILNVNLVCKNIMRFHAGGFIQCDLMVISAADWYIKSI